MNGTEQADNDQPIIGVKLLVFELTAWQANIYRKSYSFCARKL